MPNYFVYIVRCSDGTYYTGFSTDVEKRVKTHNAGKGAKYTRCRLPVTLEFVRQMPSMSDAMSLEYQIKQMSRIQKQILILEYKHKRT